MKKAEQEPLEGQNTQIEIERKFKPDKLPHNLDSYTHKDILQIYTEILEDGTETRFRKKGDEYFRSVKQGVGLIRTEDEVLISAEEFQKAQSSAIGQVEKTRYEIPYEKWQVELDVYTGNLKGLIIAEIEFASIEDSKSFQPPSWLGKEVTGNPIYANQYLALHGF